MSRAGKHCSGFTYPIVLVSIVVLTIGTGIATDITATRMQREREEELLFRGLAYRDAIGSYYRAVPAQPAYPRSIDELLNDPRFAKRRHLRQAYADPTGGEWRLIASDGGRIMGVASRSEQVPLKRAYLPKEITQFSDAKRLSEWEFVFLPDANL